MESDIFLLSNRNTLQNPVFVSLILWETKTWFFFFFESMIYMSFCG